MSSLAVVDLCTDDEESMATTAMEPEMPTKNPEGAVPSNMAPYASQSSQKDITSLKISTTPATGRAKSVAVPHSEYLKTELLKRAVSAPPASSNGPALGLPQPTQDENKIINASVSAQEVGTENPSTPAVDPQPVQNEHQDAPLEIDLTLSPSPPPSTLPDEHQHEPPPIQPAPFHPQSHYKSNLDHIPPHPPSPPSTPASSHPNANATTATPSSSNTSSLLPDSNSSSSRPRTRPWTAAQIATLATELQYSFDFDQFAATHGKTKQDVFDVFSAVVQMPLLSYSEKGIERAKRMREFRKVIKDYRVDKKNVVGVGSGKGKGRGRGKG